VWRHSEMVVASRRSRWQSGHVRQRASRSRVTMTEPLPAPGARGDEAGAPRRALFLLLPPLLGSSASSPSSCTGGGGGSTLTLGAPSASSGGESVAAGGDAGGDGEVVGPGCMAHGFGW
jgi:hypothetical protein